MDASKLFEERKELFKNAIHMKKNTRVPTLSSFYTWKILDAGYKLSEAMDNYELMEKIQRDFHEQYPFDAYMDLGKRNPKRVTDALGTFNHMVDDENEVVVSLDRHHMEADEYKDFSKDPRAFYWSKAFASYCSNDLTYSRLYNASSEFLKYVEFNTKMNAIFKNEYGCLLCAPFLLVPFEIFFMALRGIKELSLDIRKRKEELKEALDVYYREFLQPKITAAVASDTNNFFCDLMCAFLGHSILSTKQFEELYWPHLKLMIDQLGDKQLYIFCESTMMRFAEFFQDIPKGKILIHVEQDDIFEMRKKLPNISFAGGMPTDLLGHGTPQQCVDYAKKLIDEVGEGYVFSMNKMMSFRNDCKRENLKSVMDFVLNYTN